MNKKKVWNEMTDGTNLSHSKSALSLLHLIGSRVELKVKTLNIFVYHEN